MTTTEKIDTLSVKQSIDLRELAGRYTTLHRESAREMAGPCPKPSCDAKVDGFHVHADGWFFCRKCHPKRGDAIEFVRWMDGVDFLTAVNSLQGHSPMPAPAQRRTPDKAHDKECKGLPTWAASRLANAQDRLMCGNAGAPGRAYLECLAELQ